MWRMCMSILVSGWILTTPALWVHRPEQAVLGFLVGLVGIILSFAAVVRPRLAAMVFALGAIRALSTFVYPDTFISNVDSLTSGLLLVIAGMYPRLVVTAAAVAVREPRRPSQEAPRLAA
jgi:hypothetical protein